MLTLTNNHTERMPIKGIFLRFNGFQHRGWYFVPPFNFEGLNRLKKPLNAVLGFLQYSFQRYFPKTPFNPPPKERPQRAFSCVLTAFLIEGGINIPPFNFDGLNRLKKPLNGILKVNFVKIPRLRLKRPFHRYFHTHKNIPLRPL